MNTLLLVGWLIWVYRPFETVLQSISGRLVKRGRKRRERIDENKNVQTTPTRTYCKRSRPLRYCNPNFRTPRHWKFTQHHRTNRPSPNTLLLSLISSLSGTTRNNIRMARLAMNLISKDTDVVFLFLMRYWQIQWRNYSATKEKQTQACSNLLASRMRYNT